MIPAEIQDVVQDITDAGFTYDYDPMLNILRIRDVTQNTKERVQWTCNADKPEATILQIATYFNPEEYVDNWFKVYPEDPTLFMAAGVFEDGLILYEKWQDLEKRIMVPMQKRFAK